MITRTASERIAQYAFAYARANNRKRVTVVHKADLMKLVDGLFLDCCREASAMYPDVEFEEMLIDNAVLKVRACVRACVPARAAFSCWRGGGGHRFDAARLALVGWLGGLAAGANRWRRIPPGSPSWSCPTCTVTSSGEGPSALVALRWDAVVPHAGAPP